MSTCININDSNFKDLVEKSGLKPLQLEAKMQVWMKNNNTDVAPTLEQLGVSSNIKSEVGSTKHGQKEYRFFIGDKFVKNKNEVGKEITNELFPIEGDTNESFAERVALEYKQTNLEESDLDFVLTEDLKRDLIKKHGSDAIEVFNSLTEEEQMAIIKCL